MMIAAWRDMRAGDLPAVMRLANRIHPGLPEGEAIFSERLRLFPQGCRVLAVGDETLGYAIAHPIRYPHPPSLDTLLGTLAPVSDAFYIHDVAIAPPMRGQGHAEAAVSELLAIAGGYLRACLISVYGTVPFWRRFGFVDAQDGPPPEKLSAYGTDARFMVRLPSV